MNSHLDQVLDCFVRMDVEGLGVLLQEPTYYDVPRDLFLERLKNFFEDFMDPDYPESFRLDHYPGVCCSSQCDIFPNRLGFKFVSWTGNHFDLRFVCAKDENGEEKVKDIFPCFHLITNEMIDEEELGSHGHFWVYEDDRVTFEKDADYEVNLQKALEGMAYWSSKKENEEFTLAEIKAWLISYEPTFMEIGPYIPSESMFWKWTDFLALYEQLDLFMRFLEDFRVDLARFSVVDVSTISHKELIDWLLHIEERMEESHYWRLHGGVFTRLEQEFYKGKLQFWVMDSARLETEIRQPVEDFLKWFAEERKKWTDYYFALTSSEYDEFIEQNTDKEELFRVDHLLGFHWETREKFRKQGVYIPFNLKKPPVSFRSFLDDEDDYFNESDKDLPF